MRSLYINYETLRRNDSALIVRNGNHQVKYLVNGRWGNQLGKITVNSLYGDELLAINQLTAGKIQRFEITCDHHQISTFRRVLNNYDHPLYLKKLHWLIWGNQRQLKYRAFELHRPVMKTQITQTVPKLLEIKVNRQADEPIVCGVITLLNYWALLDEQLLNPDLTKLFRQNHQNELA